MDGLSFRLFGRFDARCHERPLPPVENGKAQELLCYLLLHGDRPHHRDILADIFWGDTSAPQPRKLLRQALWHLQSTFRSSLGDEPGMLVIEPDWICLNPAIDTWVDVRQFHEAFMTVREVNGPSLTTDNLETVRDAVMLYTGDLLEGWYWAWCQDERQRIQTMYVILVDKLVSYCESRQLYELGIEYASLILRVDRAHERTHRRLMRMHDQAGDRTAALRQYHRCRAALAQELGIRPSPVTDGLYAHLAAGSSPRVVVAVNNTSTSPHILERLMDLRMLLDELDSQVRDNRTV